MPVPREAGRRRLSRGRTGAICLVRSHGRHE